MAQKILLNGYYGFGNLGDDLLLKISHQLVADLFPESVITICANGLNNRYIPSLVDSPVDLIKDDQDTEFDWIIDGGGGVYFDFSHGPVWYGVLNTFISVLGPYRWNDALQLYRKLKGNIGLRAKNRVGLGIGIGTYTRTSRRFFADVAKMATYTLLLVRDKTSAAHAVGLGIKCPVGVASDLAFLRKYWLPEHVRTGEPEAIGFVLRDWPDGNEQTFSAVKQVAETLMVDGYRVMFFSFDEADKAYAGFFSEFDFTVWHPKKMTMSDMLRKIASCKLIITSRAHGAIIPACMGIPLIVLAIEPKLQVVFNWFSESSVLVSYPVLKNELWRAIQQQLGRLDQSRFLISNEVKKQESIMEEGMRTFAELIQKSR